eukprot:m.47548 g.47548  ORF g.47548 m.47548 type:complete len:295 (-) comp20516_c0_seq1:33-917(-)
MERSRKVNNQVQNELYGDDLRKKSLLGLVAVAVVILLFGFVSSQNGNTMASRPGSGVVHEIRWGKDKSEHVASEPLTIATSSNNIDTPAVNNQGEEDFNVNDQDQSIVSGSQTVSALAIHNLSRAVFSKFEMEHMSDSQRPKQTQVFLADLKIADSYVGYGNVGLGASLGFEGKKFQVEGKKYKKGVSIHAASSRAGPAFVSFNIGGKYAWFSSVVAINDNNNMLGRTGSELTFVVKGDDITLWKSNPVQNTLITQNITELNIVGVNVITLQVHAAGSNACAHSVWLDPVVKTL